LPSKALLPSNALAILEGEAFDAFAGLGFA